MSFVKSSCREWGSNPRPTAVHTTMLTTTPYGSRQNEICTEATNANIYVQAPLANALIGSISPLFTHFVYGPLMILMWLA